MESFTDSAAVSLRSGQLGCLNLFGVMLPQRKTPLTANLLLSYTVCAVAFAYSLPKPIKLLMCWLGTRPIMQIRQKKKKHLSYSDHGSYLTLHSEGHRFQWSFFTVCEQSHVLVLCVPPDLRDIVFVLQSQSNSFHVRQAERRRADLLKQADDLAEVRFNTSFHSWRRALILVYWKLPYVWEERHKV